MIDEPSLPMIAGRPDGCVDGWRLYLATTVAAVWIPLAATLIPANRADDEEAPAPTRGPVTTQRFARGAVLVHRLTLLHRVAAGADLRVGLEPVLQAA